MLRVSIHPEPIVLALLAFALPLTLSLHADAASLPAYNADIKQTSVSGVSSGASMAVQARFSRP